MKPASLSFAKEHGELLGQLKTQRFNGKLLLEGSGDQQRWFITFHLGRFVYATGGKHPVRRFYRLLKPYDPTFDLDKVSELLLPSCSPEALREMGWDYELLRVMYEQNRLKREQAYHIVAGALVEALVDIIQTDTVSYQLLPQPIENPSCIFLSDPVRLIEVAVQLWHRWEQANLVAYSFNDALVIRQPERLRQKTSDSVYRSLSQLLDGKSTIRDLAAIRQRDVVEITRSLESYIKEGLVVLQSVPDFPTPSALKAFIQVHQGNSQPLSRSTAPKKPLIACVDDSPLVCQTMEKIFSSEGYQYLAIQNSLRAVPQLLASKPALIFLDLVMPNTNGYEVCSQLRKLTQFKDTPIIILTGNDGIVDRVRAKVVGATDFLGKPVDGSTVLAVTEKYLLTAKL